MKQVMLWTETDIPLFAERTYADPYRDAAVHAVFRHESGRELALDGFWDGGNRWIVRFAPTLTGIWRYELAFADGSRTENGMLEAVPYTGDNPLYRHGFLQVADSGRYLCHADKTPFFWLADTHWLGLGARERLYESNFPLFSSMFRGMADYRRLQEYTVYQMNFFLSAAGDCDGTGTSNEGGPLWLDHPFGRLNPDFFRNTDIRIRYLVSLGITPCLGMDWGHAIRKDNVEEFARAVRYVIARYCALPVVWFVAGEFGGSSDYACWNDIGRQFEQYDPYAHVTTIHGNGENFVEDPAAHEPNADFFREEPWYDMVMIQTGHEPNTPRRNIWRYYYDRKPTKPIFEAEQAYEGIWEVKEPLTREQAYLSIMHGSFGITYGAEGVWDDTWDTADEHQVVKPWWPVPWYDGLLLPQARHMTYLKRLFESVSWWKLEPGEYLRLSNPTHTMRDIVAKADPEKQELLVYYVHCAEDYDTDVTVCGLRSGDRYTASWYNPSTGAFEPAGTLTAEANGELPLPPRPVKHTDRMLVLRRQP